MKISLVLLPSPRKKKQFPKQNGSWPNIYPIFFSSSSSSLSGVLRAAARLVLQHPRTGHMADVMKEQLHWLDIPERVQFKLCVLAFRCLHGSAPPYLEKCCIRMIPGRLDLRSATAARGRLVVPKTNTKTISGRAFAVSCPLAWNSLPDELHDDNLSFTDFRRKLRTFLF